MTNKGSVAMLHELESCKTVVERRLGELFTEQNSYAMLLDSMRYSLLDGGKRIRAVICLKFCEAAGGLPENALDAAGAIEMLHAYTLIHDDLPCMDDDDMRRGKPSNHVKYGEFTAVLAGDALQAAAFELILKSGLPPETVVKIGRVLAETAGPHGVCGGQYLDLNGEGSVHTIDELKEIHGLKTSALISASARIGVLAAGGTKEQLQAAEDYALAVGLAFQVRDDLLDVLSTEDELGKPIGSDSENAKTTFASLLGIDACERLIQSETSAAVSALEGKFLETDFLIWLAQYLAMRKY